MIEQTSPPLDEARPWITDPDELPRRMNWLAVLFNPFGRSPQLHYTRAWMLLLLPKLLFYFGLLSMSSAQSVGELVPTILIVLIVELIFFVATTRRLNDAGRSPFLAWVLFLPAVLGLGLAVGMIPSATAQFDKAVIEFENAQKEDADKPAGVSGRQARQAASGGGRSRGRRGRRGGRGGGPGGKAVPPEKVPFIIGKTMGAAGGIWFLGSMIITIWSVMWLARLPRERTDRFSS